ncbi:hypothetical protein [Micromonospora sagamiensis]|uniref:hypothetical protein n=1 Tax=Micromonospora sagamiensis TaxID=47875 RepID=UPI00119D0A20|nr:hypothetical protein [Micromonospora sagamiensis]
MEIVELEIARRDWKSLRCGCGKRATHLAVDLRELALAEHEHDVRFNVSSGHVMLPSVLMEPALPVVSVALAALADNISVPARHQFLQTLSFILSAETQTFELAGQGRNLVDECRMAAQEGIWLLYREVFAGATVGASSIAFEILTSIDEDLDRLKHVQRASGAQLAPDVRSVDL